MQPESASESEQRRTEAEAALATQREGEGGSVEWAPGVKHTAFLRGREGRCPESSLPRGFNGLRPEAADRQALLTRRSGRLENSAESFVQSSWKAFFLEILGNLARKQLEENGRHNQGGGCPRPSLWKLRRSCNQPMESVF